MRFNILLSLSLLAVAVSGLTIPANLKERDVTDLKFEERDLFDEDLEPDTRDWYDEDLEVDTRAPGIFSAVKGAVGAVKGIAGVAGKVTKAASSVASKVGSVARKAGSAAKTATKTAGSKVKTTARNAGAKVNSSATKAKNAVKGAVKDPKGTVKNAAKSVKESAKNVKKSTKNAVADAKTSLRTPIIKNKYHVAAGGGKPAQTYSRKDIKQALKDLNNPNTSNGAKRRAGLGNFNNRNHVKQKPGSAGPNPLPGMKGKGKEYPLHTAAQRTAEPNPELRDKGPARIITQQNSKGKHKFRGVVAHDQSRPIPASAVDAKANPALYAGHGDHFKVPGKFYRRFIEEYV